MCTSSFDFYIEWCNIHEDSNNENVWYSCHHDDNTAMPIHKNSQYQIDLIRGNDTSYYANFSLESGQKFEGCDIWDRESDGWYYCDYDESTSSEQFTIIRVTWTDGDENMEQVGHWNSTSGVIHFDDGDI